MDTERPNAMKSYTIDGGPVVCCDEESGFSLRQLIADEQARWRDPSVGELVKRYFYWYRFLLLSVDYAECCKRGGAGDCSEMYNDWGDIFQLDFPEWWVRYGRRIAGLPSVSVVTEADVEKPSATRNALLLRLELTENLVPEAVGDFVTSLLCEKLGSNQPSTKGSLIDRVHPPYPTEKIFNYGHLDDLYEVHVARETQEISDADVAVLANVKPRRDPPGEQFNDHPDKQDPDRRVRLGRTAGDLKREAKEVIAFAAKKRFPFHNRRRQKREDN